MECELSWNVPPPRSLAPLQYFCGIDSSIAIVINLLLEELKSIVLQFIMKRNRAESTSQVLANTRSCESQDQKRQRMGKLQEAFKTILECLGEDPAREGILDTPQRAADAFLFWTKGYEEDLVRFQMSASVCLIVLGRQIL